MEGNDIARYLRFYNITAGNQAPSIQEVKIEGIVTDYLLESVSREKPAKASSSKTGLKPEYGSNGVPNYYWIPNTLGEEWWSVDLEGFYHMDNIQMTWNKKENHFYSIEVSTDNKNWTQIVNRIEEGNSEIRPYEPVQGFGRFIRVQLPKTRTTEQGFGLFDVYAPVPTNKEVIKVEQPTAITVTLGTNFQNFPYQVKSL